MLSVNDIVESTTLVGPLERPARVLWVSRIDNVVTLMTVVHPPKQPWSMNLAEMELSLQTGATRLTAVRTPSFMLELEEDLTEKQKAIRQKSWERIRPLIETTRPGEIYYPGAIGAMVAAHSKVSGVDRKSLYRLLYRYWLFGLTQNAFLPKYANSGGAGKARVFVNGKTPGRPPRYLGERADITAKVLSDDDKSAIKIGFALYRDNKVKSISDAYTKTLNRFYRAEHPAPDGSDDLVCLKPLNELPTMTQFQYWGKKAFDDISVQRGRSGERKWAMNHRPLAGRAHERLHGPCHRYEIDATIADIYLVSRFNRNWIIGRPVVYVVVDVFSRMIAGIFVGLEGPSWNGARHALFNAFSDKVAYCASHGITIKNEDWPCFHLPQEVVADRGEMLGMAAEGIVTGLDINLAIMPPFRPDWKSIVESRFRILNQLTQVHWIPGAVRTRIKERGERDYRLDATLDLGEFTAIIIASVLHYNHHSRDPSRLSKAMIEDDIASTPISIWNWGIEQGLGEPNIQSRDAVYLHLLPRERGTIQAGGIHFKGMIYTNQADPNGERSARARLRGREAIDVWHEPGTVDYIWIRADDKSFVQCPLRNSEVRYRDHRLEEVLDMLEITNATSSETRYAELNGKVQLDQFIDSTINTAASEKKETNVKSSKTKTIADIRENRSLERTSERVLAAQRAATSQSQQAAQREGAVERKPSDSTAQDYAGERGVEVIDLLSRLYQKGGTAL